MGQKPTKALKSAGLLRDGDDLENTEAARSSARNYPNSSCKSDQKCRGGDDYYAGGRAASEPLRKAGSLPRGKSADYENGYDDDCGADECGEWWSGRVNAAPAPPPSNEGEVGGHAAVESIPSLVASMQNGSQLHKERASAVLARVASNPANIATIAAAGSIPPLVNLAQNGNTMQRENASAALRCLASDFDTRPEIAKAGGGAVLLDGLAPDSDKEEETEVRMVFDIKAQKFVPVRRVGESNAPRSCRDILRQANMPAALPSQSPDIQRAPGPGAVNIPPLVELLQNGSDEEKEAASATLWNFAYANVGNQDCFIAEVGVVDRLVKLVSDGEGRQREVAAGVLGFAAPHLDADTKLRVAQDGGVEALLSYIAQHHQSQCVYEGITALWGLCAEGGGCIRSLVDDSGGHKIMSTIVKSDNERNQKLAGQCYSRD